MVILGASLAGSEFAWGTARHLIGRTRDRLAFVRGKLVVLVGLTLLLLVAGLVLGSLSGGGITPVIRDSITWDFLTPGLLLRLPLALFFATLTVLPYALLAFTITLVTRSTVAGLSIGLLTLMIGEPVFAQILASLPAPWSQLVYYTPSACIQIVKGWMGTLVGAAAPDHIGRSVGVLLGYSLALAGLAFASFHRRELTA
jgi:ABC-type transport system involved in multi-copper enzyme maturation permease subunit